MSAQYGNSAGSVTNLVTKSGTNEYHGSGWWFNRNDWFDANTFFGNQSELLVRRYASISGAELSADRS
jgi:outer membrane receptor for ferrienterochelin and colicin